MKRRKQTFQRRRQPLAPFDRGRGRKLVRRQDFSFDWTSWHFPNWFGLLEPYRTRRLRVLEIGSWEGRSALFFLNYLPLARLTCIDTFAGGQEHRRTRANPRMPFLRTVEPRFDANTAAFEPPHRKDQGDSHRRACRSSAAAPPFRHRLYRRQPHRGRRLQRRHADLAADGARRARDLRRLLWDNAGTARQSQARRRRLPGIDRGPVPDVWQEYQLAIVKR